jgi:hypothetical protein
MRYGERLLSRFHVPWHLGSYAEIGATFALTGVMPQLSPREFRISINSLGWTAYETRQRNYWKIVLTRGRTLVVCIGPKRSQTWKHALGQVQTHAILLNAAGWTAAI